MNPSSLIKQQLHDKLQFTHTIQDNVAGDIVNTSRLFTPVCDNLKTKSVLEFLNVSNKIDINVTEPLTYYDYPIDFLDKDIENLNVRKYKKVNLCIYTVDTTILKPFLMWLLNKINNVMYWPNFKPTANILLEAQEKIKALSIYDKSEFMGYKLIEKEVFMFYKLEDNYDILDNYKNDMPFWWGSLNEILLVNYILYYKIHNSVKNLFLQDRRLLYLKDIEGDNYEIPIIGFNGSNSYTMDYNVKIGLNRGNPSTASQGPYYYFANYLRAAKFGSWNVMGNYKEKDIDGEIITDNEYGRYKNGGIIRFILFPNKIKVYLNRPWDKKIKQIPSMQKSITETSTEYKLKLFDTKGNWANEYDSVFLGPLEVSDNVYVHSGISCVVKNFLQYKSISYHYFNKKSIPENIHQI